MCEEIQVVWEKAPEWAKYLTKDTRGEWWWFEFEPSAYRGDFINMQRKGRCELVESLSPSEMCIFKRE